VALIVAEPAPAPAGCREDTPQGDAADTTGLLSWWEAHQRDLPWRRTRDPWAVLVSEVMLQQTQVARALQRYGPFLERFPTAQACAASTAAAVIEQWSGLGYNRRALALHRCATAVVDHHGGVFPDRLEPLLALPGVGPYTARAVLAFAFERDVAVVDTNVARTLARLAGRPLRPREVQSAADAAVPAGRGWAWNQAALDVGALVCTRRAPACERCPLRPTCSWWRARQLDPSAADPAAASALTGRRQSRFDGSDRQGRGRLVAALRDGPVADAGLPAAMGWPDDPVRARRVAATLVADGLAAPDEAGTWRLAP
jgi:A/G-specific adenine glycosylase